MRFRVQCFSALLAVVACAMPGRILADTTAYPFTLTHDGESAGDQFGWSVEKVGRIDADNADDFIVGAPYRNGGGGGAYVYSGATGQLIWSLSGTPSSYSFIGFGVAGIDDVNGDGKPDVLVGSPGSNGSQGSAAAYSGINGALLRAFSGEDFEDEFGLVVAGLGDVDGDGRGDVAIASPFHDDSVFFQDNFGKVYVYSMQTGSLLYSKYGEDEITGYLWNCTSSPLFGVTLSGAVDFNSDGVRDLAVGAPGCDSVYVYSGATGAKLQEIFLPVGGLGAFGRYVSSLSAVKKPATGATVPGLVVGLSRDDPAGPGAYLFAGDDWSLIRAYDEPRATVTYGGGPRDAGDVNRDGLNDIVIADPLYDGEAGPNTGRVYVYSGAADGALLYTVEGESPEDRLAPAVGVGDVNLDAYGDIAVTSPYHDGPAGPNTGRVYVALGPQISSFNVDVSQAVASVQRPLFGMNLTWEAKFNGVSPVTAAPLPSSDPVYRDAMKQIADNLRSAAPLSTGFRYPGGLFANFFNWEKAYKPWEQRAILTGRDNGNKPGDFYHLFGITEFLCAIEDAVTNGILAYDPTPATRQYLPVTLTLASPTGKAIDRDSWSADSVLTTTGKTLTQSAADLYDFLNAPTNAERAAFAKCPQFDQSNNVTGFRSHPQPFNVRYFEIGNETRSGQFGGFYGSLAVRPMATAMHQRRKALGIPSDELQIGVVSYDAYPGGADVPWQLWNLDVWNSTHDAVGPLCAEDAFDPQGVGRQPPLSMSVECFDAWSMHHYPPGRSGIGIEFRHGDDVLATSRTLPAGSYRFEARATANTPGGWEQCLRLRVYVNAKETLFPPPLPVESSSTVNLPFAGTLTLASPAQVGVRTEFIKIRGAQPADCIGVSDNTTPTEGQLSVYPLIAAVRQDVATDPVPVEYFDLRSARGGHLTMMSGPAYLESILTKRADSLRPQDLAVWLTEHHTQTVQPMPDSEAPNLQDALNTAVFYHALLRQGPNASANRKGITQAYAWEAFEEPFKGMIEGVSFDNRGEGETADCPPSNLEGECRVKARTDPDPSPRIRPKAQMLKLIAETALVSSPLGDGDVVVQTGPSSNSNPKYSTGPNAGGGIPGGFVQPPWVEENYFFQMGFAGAPHSVVGAANESDGIALGYVQVLATANAARDRVNFSIINVDPDRPATVYFTVRNGTTAYPLTPIDGAKTLSAKNGLVTGGVRLLKNDEALNRVRVAYKCFTALENNPLSVLRRDIPGHDQCPDPPNGNVQVRDVRICSDPSTNPSDAFCPDGNVAEAELPWTQNANVLAVTVPPASVTRVRTQSSP